MGSEQGKKVTAAIDNLLDKAERKGRKLSLGDDDGSRRLLVENAAGLAGADVTDCVKGFSAPSAYILTATLIAESAKMRVQAYHRPERPGTQTGLARLELSGTKTRNGLEVIVENADSESPTVLTGLPGDLLAQKGDVVYFAFSKIMQARPPEVQVRDGLGVTALATLALGLAGEKK